MPEMCHWSNPSPNNWLRSALVYLPLQAMNMTSQKTIKRLVGFVNHDSNHNFVLTSVKQI